MKDVWLGGGIVEALDLQLVFDSRPFRFQVYQPCVKLFTHTHTYLRHQALSRTYFGNGYAAVIPTAGKVTADLAPIAPAMRHRDLSGLSTYEVNPYGREMSILHTPLVFYGA